MNAIKTALVGFGMSAQRFHMSVFRTINDIELTAVVSSKPQFVHSILPDVTVYQDIKNMLAETSIELVIIVTPNEFHFFGAKAALQAGKHVVVEKPFVITCQEGVELIAEAKRCQRCLTVYQNRRCDGDFRTVQRLINEGALGDVHTFYSSYNRYIPKVKVRWRESSAPGAGILYDLGAHIIDQAIVLFGKPKSVSATLRRQRPGAEAVDHFHLVLGYENKDVILHSNYLSCAAGPRFQVFGNQGAFIKYGMDPQESYLQEGHGPDAKGWGEDSPGSFGVLTDASGLERTIPTVRGGYEDFYHQLIKTLRNKEPLPVDPLQVLDTIAVIESALQSHTQQKVILL